MAYKSKRNQATFVSYQLAQKFLNQKETLGILVISTIITAELTGLSHTGIEKSLIAIY